MVEEVYKTPIVFPKVLDSEENSSYRHHHYNLSKKISELCERITELEYTVKILRSMKPDWHYNFHKKLIKEIEKQEKISKSENKKLKKLKEKYSFLGGIK